MHSRKQQDITLNSAQIKASDPSASVYLSASAGTGKTKVLSDRFLRLLLKGTEINKILCLSFTNAAASEMRERIISRLRAWAEMNDEELTSSLFALTGESANILEIANARSLFEQYLKLSSQVQIQTIHSLCQNILSKSPASTIGSKLVTQFQADQFFNAAYNSALEEENLSPYFSILLNKYENSYIKNSLVRNCISDKLNFVQFHRHKHDTYALYGVSKDFSETEKIKSFIEQYLPKIRTILGNADINTFEQIESALLTSAGEIRKAVEKKPELADIADRFLNLKREIDNKKAADLNNAFVEINYFVFQKYEALKKNKKFYDYSDLLILAKQILEESESALSVLYSLDCSIEHVLVDEAQDLSELQWSIIYAITDEFFSGLGASEVDRTIFIVGDFKQSIYSFQGSEPQIFLQAKNRFAKKASDANKKWLELDMQVSYRSTKPILDFVNNVSAKLFKDENIDHQSFKDSSGEVIILDLIKNEREKKSNEWSIPNIDKDYKSKEQLLAEQIANHVEDMISSGEYQPRDFLILLKKRGKLMRSILNELKARGIESSDPDKLNISQELIVQDLIALAKFVLLPIDDFNLACLLKSAFFGISEEYLQKLCLGRGEESLYSKLSEKVEELNYFRKSYTGDILNFYIHILEGKGYKNKFVERFGRRALDIIHQFYNILNEYNETEISDLENFVSYIDDNEIFIKIENDPNINQVSVMTVHGSKGLQSRVVILADSSLTPNTNQDKIIWHNNFPFLNIGIDSPTLNKIKNIEKTKIIQEDMRLFYVAMTRAESKLLLTGFEGSRQTEKSWYSLANDCIQ